MHQYNPNIHHRRSIRLKGYDYSQAGLYFITICCYNRICRFGHIENNEMHLNEYGKIAYNEWIKLSKRFPNIELDAFQIMPNHMHAILKISPAVRATFTVAPNLAPKLAPNIALKTPPLFTLTTSPTTPEIIIGDIIGAYKSLVANECLEIYKSKNMMMGKLWHRNYWEHIIRNDEAYHRISTYIINNPLNWNEDKFNG